MVVGSFSPNSSNKLKYNGLTFIKTETGYWQTTIGELNFLFRYNPEEVEGITDQPTENFPLATDYLSKPLYYTTTNSLTYSEISQNTMYFVERFQQACLNETNCPENIPIKNCTENFIILKYEEEPSITFEENCVFISGNQEGTLKLIDDFLFRLLGIKQ